MIYLIIACSLPTIKANCALWKAPVSWKRARRLDFSSKTNTCTGPTYIASRQINNTVYDIAAIACNSTRYKLLMKNPEIPVYGDIADYNGRGEDHCELVGTDKAYLPNVQTEVASRALDTGDGHYRLNWGESFQYTNSLHAGSPAWYECGISIPSSKKTYAKRLIDTTVMSGCGITRTEKEDKWTYLNVLEETMKHVWMILLGTVSLCLLVAIGIYCYVHDAVDKIANCGCVYPIYIEDTETPGASRSNTPDYIDVRAAIRRQPCPSPNPVAIDGSNHRHDPVLNPAANNALLPSATTVAAPHAVLGLPAYSGTCESEAPPTYEEAAAFPLVTEHIQDEHPPPYRECIA